MDPRAPSLPPVAILRAESEVSYEGDDDEDEEDQLEGRSSPNPFTRTGGMSQAHVTASRSSASTSTMAPPRPPQPSIKARPIQKRKESEGRTDDVEKAVKRAKHDEQPVANKRPGFHSGGLARSTASGSRGSLGSSQQRTAGLSSKGATKSNSTNVSTSKISMPPPSVPSRTPHTQSSSFTPKPPSTGSSGSQMKDIPSTLSKSLFIAAAKKKKQNTALAGSSTRTTQTLTASTSSSKSPFSHTKTKSDASSAQPETIVISSDDSDPDLPKPPPSQMKTKTKQSSSSTTGSRSKQRTSPRKELVVVGVIDLTEGDDKEKPAKNIASAKSVSNAQATSLTGQKSDDRMDVEPSSSSNALTTLTSAASVSRTVATKAIQPAQAKSSMPSTASKAPTAGTPSPAKPLTASQASVSKPDVYLKFTPSPPVPAASKAPSLGSTKPTGVEYDMPPKAASDNVVPGTTQPTATDSYRPRPSRTGSTSSLSSAAIFGPSSGQKLQNTLETPASKMPAISMTTQSTSSSLPKPSNARPPSGHKHQLAFKTTGDKGRYQSKLPVQANAIASLADSESSSSSASSSSTSSSSSKLTQSNIKEPQAGPSGEESHKRTMSGQIDMRDLDTALPLPPLPTRQRTGKGKQVARKDVTPPTTAAKTTSPAVANSPSKNGVHKQTSSSGTKDLPIDLTSDPEDNPEPEPAQSTTVPSVTATSQSSTDELSIRPSLHIPMFAQPSGSAVLNSASPPPDSALDDSLPGTPSLPGANILKTSLKESRRVSAPTLGETVKALDKGKQPARRSPLSQTINLQVQSVPTSPTGVGLGTPAVVPSLTPSGPTQDAMMQDAQREPRRSLTGAEEEEIEQSLVADLDSISMDDNMNVDSEPDVVPSYARRRPQRSRKRLLSPTTDDDLSTASGPSTSTRSSRRSSRLSKGSSRANSASDGVANSTGARRRSAKSSRDTSPETASGTLLRPMTLGGLQVLQFNAYRKDARTFPPVLRAADLKTHLYDLMNSLKAPMSTHQQLRDIFKAMILQNTASDEPKAPPITIENPIDDQPTPPWNFYYTNKMWHGDNVPDPDIKNLKGCGCVGTCSPKRPCLCVKRNDHHKGDRKAPPPGYDQDGRLTSPGYEVYECNNMCGCDENCYLRVVQRGRRFPVSITKTPNRGWGVFNGSASIPPLSFIGIYSGELITEQEGSRRGVYYNQSGITYLFSLDFYHTKEARVNKENLYVVDAFHVGNFTRFLNHSCEPNCRLYPIYINEGDIQKPLLTIFSIRDIAPHEEICFNYHGKYPGDEPDDDGDSDDGQDGGNKDEDQDGVYIKCQCGAKTCKQERIFM